jgi:hypothetical protein
LAADIVGYYYSDVGFGYGDSGGPVYSTYDGTIIGIFIRVVN